MKLSSNLTKHLTLGAIFGAALLFGFGAQETNAQVYQDRYYDGYYNDNGYYRQDGQDRSHRKQEKRELKHHQRHERENYGNSRALRAHLRQERRQVKRHQQNERGYNRGRYYGNEGYLYNY